MYSGVDVVLPLNWSTGLKDGSILLSEYMYRMWGCWAKTLHAVYLVQYLGAVLMSSAANKKVYVTMYESFLIL